MARLPMARPTRTMLLAAAAVVVAAMIGGGVTYLAATPSAGADSTAAAPGDVSRLHVGDTVQVMATRTNGAVTATRISPARG